MAESLGWNFTPSRDFKGDWRGYFAEYTHALADLKHENEEKTLENSVVVPRHSITADELPKNIVTTVKPIIGDKFKAQHSQTFHEGAVFKTGPNAGEKRPDKTVDHYAIGLVSKSPLTAVWSDGKLQYAKAYRNGELLWTDRVTVLKNWIKGGWE